MSYPLDVDAQNAALDAVLGDGAAASMPTSFELALFNGDPANGGTELTPTGGYARATADNDTATFPDADSGQKVSATISFTAPSGPWVGVTDSLITHWLLLDAADSTTQYFSMPFADPFAILGDEPDVSVQLVLMWNTEGS